MDTLLTVQSCFIRLIDVTQHTEIGDVDTLVNKSLANRPINIDYQCSSNKKNFLKIKCYIRTEKYQRFSGMLYFVRYADSYTLYDYYFPYQKFMNMFALRGPLEEYNIQFFVITSDGIYANEKKLNKKIYNLCEFIKHATIRHSLLFGIAKNGKVVKTKSSGRTFRKFAPSNRNMLMKKINDYVTYGHWNELKIELAKEARKKSKNVFADINIFTKGVLDI